jgi:hypothetical protein
MGLVGSSKYFFPSPARHTPDKGLIQHFTSEDIRMGTNEEKGALPRLSIETLLHRQAENRFRAEGVVYEDGGYTVVDFSSGGSGPLYCFRTEDIIVDSAAGAEGNAVRGLSIREGSPCVRLEATTFSKAKAFGDEYEPSQLFFPNSTQDWSWAKVYPKFGKGGCTTSKCPYNAVEHPGSDLFYCSLNLSEALIASGYTLPAASNVNYCDHKRVRNADGMARICKVQNGGAIDESGWDKRPSWNGIVYFEGGPSLSNATGHIDLYDGKTKTAVHTSYPDANVVWFWKMGA